MKHPSWTLPTCLIVILLYEPALSQEDDADHSHASHFPWARMNATGTDLVFLLDRSGSVGHAGFETELTFVDSFVSHFDVMANATRVAIVSFSDTAVVHADFLKEPGNKCQLSRLRQSAANVADYHGTNTGAGLQEVRKIFQNSREHAAKVLLLVTDGLPTVGPDPVTEANHLKDAGVEIFVFAIGTSIMRRALADIASSPDHLFECETVMEFLRSFDPDGATRRWTTWESPRNCDGLCKSPYRGQEDDPGCCKRNAVCGCDLATGASACLCGPGFYGDGLHGQCTPCKPNTYKETYFDERCQACPANSEIRNEGSRSLKDCKCKTGYVGDPVSGKPCVPLSCPPLQAPEHGYLEEKCDTSYMGECLLGCHEGYRLQSGEDDADIRTCQGDGTWSGNTTVCLVKTCDTSPAPENGGYTGCKAPWELNDTCLIHCEKGFNLKGRRSRTCKDGGWSGDDVVCELVQCPPPRQVPNAVPAGDIRVKKVYSYSEIFVVRCLEGFELRGPRVITCGEDGEWFASPGENPDDAKCVDVEKPRITCPEDVRVRTDVGKNSVRLSWPAPTYSDNDKSSSLFLTPPYHPGARSFPIGTYGVDYTVTDGAGLSDSCRFTITVLDEEKPQVRRCPYDRDVNATDDEARVYWELPLFADNSGDFTLEEPNRKPGSMFGLGTHRITYTARDKSGNSATCVFHINVWRSNCPFHPAPLNGALACDDQYYGQFCQALCDDRFEFLSKPAEAYICDDSLQWKTLPRNMPVPWPDCALKSLPTQARKLYHAYYYYHGDCRDPIVQNTIRRIFIKNFERTTNKSSKCGSVNKCQLNTVGVSCGRVMELGNAAGHSNGSWLRTRLTRSVVDEPTTNASIAAVDAQFVLDVSEENEVAFQNDTEKLAAAVDEILRGIGEIDPLVLEQVADEDHVTVDMRLKDYYTEDYAVVCADGEALNSDGDCVKCPKGSFHDRELGYCAPCPTGTYQDQDGTVACKPCPEGAVTIASKSTSAQDCQAPCPPGTFSRNGLGTCRTCPPGTYQDQYQQVQCKLCPAGSSNDAYGSAQITDCKKYCEPGTYSESGREPCTPCERGFYQEMRGRKSCVECPVPKTNLNEGSRSSHDCVEVDHCASHPCTNGTCVTRQHDFVCRQHRDDDATET
ncbi:sushi, von Willebrand factor type A, EGF and pentraxin domain-containing protein 1 isoform X2 [Rhipicephalus microplus]|uniref:sushi, von Willebrand factor type A, EGF and pentraxin domain-containing protein 1 isoform X2 n=1 Tax=Rhipicephalus microplus TaxID=6941 RepID=UPI003F6A8AD2